MDVNIMRTARHIVVEIRVTWLATQLGVNPAAFYILNSGQLFGEKTTSPLALRSAYFMYAVTNRHSLIKAS